MIKSQTYCDICGKLIEGATYPAYVSIPVLSQNKKLNLEFNCSLYGRDDDEEGGDTDLCKECAFVIIENMLPEVLGAFEKKAEEKQKELDEFNKNVQELKQTEEDGLC